MPDLAEARYLVAVSLKDYFGHRRTLEWAGDVSGVVQTHVGVRDGSVGVLVFPGFLALREVVGILSPHPVGAQDVSAYEHGPYTGEVAAESLAEIGVSAAEIGHAERRALFGETDDLVRAKTTAAARAGVVPLICVGEIEPGGADDAADECVAQLMDAVADLGDAHPTPIIVAYEPVWAIGAAEPAADEHIRTVCRRLAERVREAPFAPGGRVLYGGSAKPGLLTRIAPDVGGLFLGRFAHDPAAFSAVLDEAHALAAAFPGE